MKEVLSLKINFASFQLKYTEVCSPHTADLGQTLDLHISGAGLKKSIVLSVKNCYYYE